MHSEIQSGKLTRIENISEVSEGSSIRCVGVLRQNIMNEIILTGTNQDELRLDTESSVIQLKFGYPYLVIGELHNGILHTRICREISFKKFSLDYYLKVLPGCLSTN